MISETCRRPPCQTCTKNFGCVLLGSRAMSGDAIGPGTVLAVIIVASIALDSTAYSCSLCNLKQSSSLGSA